MRILKFVLLSLTATFFTLDVMSQESPVRESDTNLWQNARQLFESGNYEAASEYLTRWNATENTARQGYLVREEADYMAAVIQSELSPSSGKKVLQNFLENYPGSIWNNRVKALTGIASALCGEYDEALVWFGDCNPENLSSEDCRRMTFYNALSLLKTGQIEEGTTILQVLDYLGGYDDEVVFYKAYADYYKGNLSDAKSGFNRSLHSSDYEDKSKLYLAEILLREGNPSDAVKMAASLVDSDDLSVSSEAERILGEANFEMGNWSGADEFLTSYVMGDTESKRTDMYKLGITAWHLGDYSRALDCLGKVSMEGDAVEQSAWYHMGLCSLELGNRSDALLAFEQAASMTSDKKISEMGLYNYAMCLLESGYSPFAEPVNAFERFLNEYPYSDYAEKISESLVDVYLQSNNYDQALQSLEKIQNPGKKLLEARQQLLYRKGIELYAQGEFDKVSDYMTKVIELEKYDNATAVNAAFWRAETDFRLEKFSQAASDYNRYITRSSSGAEMYGQALYGAGYAAYEMRDWDKALAQWTRLTDGHSSGVSDEVIADALARMGDCHFYKHDYKNAEKYYGKSLSAFKPNGDYALYRMGLVQGLQKDYKGKISMMERLCKEYPTSGFCVQGLYEEGRAYQQLDQSTKAIGVFDRIRQLYPKSDFARKASAEIAMVYYQNDNYDKAIPAYKSVIENYPGSEEAATALRDLKSIYVEIGKVDQYLAYSESVSGAAPVAISERDSLTYTSAERLFTKGELDDACTAFEGYIKQFPDGGYVVNAYYYLGAVYNEKKDYDNALECWLRAAQNENSRFCTDALEQAARLAYQTGDYALSLATYKRLYERDKTAEAGRNSLIGILRSAYKAENFDDVLEYAGLAANSRLNESLMTEVRYYKGKALLYRGAQNDALQEFKSLSEDTRSVYGAESNYMVSQILFERKEYAQAEANIKALISEGTPHEYWLARSFILLADVYSAQDKKLDARQYLLSLQQNYNVDDDIPQMIEERLKKLNDNQ